MEALMQRKKSLVLILVKAKAKFCLSFHYDGDNSFFVNGKEIYKFEANSKIVNRPTQFCLGTINNKFSYVDTKEISLKGNAYDFLVAYNSIDKSDILNIHKYSVVKIM